MKMTSTDWILLLVLSAFWGSSFFLIEIALQDLPVLTLVALRLALAAIVLWLFVLLNGATVPTAPKLWLSFAFMGLLNNIIPFSLIVWGQTAITSSLAAILNATTPLFAVLIAALFLSDEKPTPNKLAGLAVGFAGVIIMIGPDAIAQIGTEVFAQIAVVLAALSYALAGAYGRRFSRLGVKPVVSAAIQITMSTIMLGSFVLIAGDHSAMSTVTPESWAAIVALAVFSTAVAYILYFRILASAGVTNLMLVTFLIPVTAVLLGVTILNEQLGASEWIGMTMIALALVAIDGRVFQSRSAANLARSEKCRR